MLKALKKGIKKLSSSSKLQEAAGATEAAAAAPPAAAPKVAHVPPPGLPRPPSPLGQQQKPTQQPHAQPLQQPQPGTLPVAAAAAEGGARRPASPPLPAAPAGAPHHEELGGGMVDYELVAGPLELDTADEGEAAAGASCSYGAEAAAGDAERHPAEGAEQLPSVCYGSGDQSGSLAAAAAAQEEEAAAAAAGDAGEHPPGGGAGGDAGAAEGTAAAATAAASAGAAGEGEVSEALAAMMYLTEDAEGNDDCVSVVSDALSDDKDFPDDISELSRALEALEGEALAGSSPGVSAEASGALEDQLAERLGISPDADPSAFAQQMAKLYNNLGLKMMERRKHEEALGLLRKAEAVVENTAMWPGAAALKKRARMQAITYNNLGCLFKRRNMPQLALQHLQKALALEEAMGGSVQNRSSTHLNICAAFSALKRPKEALSHAERAIILLQRALWPHHLNFQDGLSTLVRQLAVPGTARALLGSANVLAMAYHNAAVEHEKLGRLREALVSFTRAYLISSKCLGHKAPMTINLSKALKSFQQRQARYLPSGAAHAARKAPSLAARGAAGASQSKRSALTHSRPTKTAGAAKSGGTSSSSLSKATLPLDKGRTTAAVGIGPRAASTSRLATALQQQQQQQQLPGL